MSLLKFYILPLALLVVVVVSAKSLDPSEASGAQEEKPENEKVKRHFAVDHEILTEISHPNNHKDVNGFFGADNTKSTVVKTVAVPYPVTKYIPYPVEKKIPYSVPVEKKVKVLVEKTVPYPVKKIVPLKIEKKIPVPVPVERKVPIPYPVEKPVPYPVPVEKKIPVPFPVEKPIPVPVVKNIPYPVPVEKKIPVPIPYAVPVQKTVKVPFLVEKQVPYPVPYQKIVPVPYPVKLEKVVPVPVPVKKPVIHLHADKKILTSRSGEKNGEEAHAERRIDQITTASPKPESYETTETNPAEPKPTFKAPTSSDDELEPGQQKREAPSGTDKTS